MKSSRLIIFILIPTILYITFVSLSLEEISIVGN